MTLGDMRQHGVRQLTAYCNNQKCHHHSIVDVDRHPNDALVTSFGPRMVCTQCGSRDVHARPNWAGSD